MVLPPPYFLYMNKIMKYIFCKKINSLQLKNLHILHYTKVNNIKINIIYIIMHFLSEVVF